MRQTFVQVDAFVAAFNQLDPTEGDLVAIEADIAADPDRPPVIPGTGGLHKTRFAPPSKRIDKSGGSRVAYFWFPVHFPVHATVYLLQIFRKKDLANPTAEHKRRARAVAGRFAAHLEHLASHPAKRLNR